MTVITVVAIAAVAALFYAFVWPAIQRNIVQQTCNTFGTGYTAEKVEGATTGSDKTSKWLCKCSKTAGGDCTKDIEVDK